MLLKSAKDFLSFCFNGTNESLLILNDDSATVYLWRIFQRGDRFWKQLKYFFSLQKLNWIRQRRKSAKLLELKLGKVHLMIILSSVRWGQHNEQLTNANQHEASPVKDFANVELSSAKEGWKCFVLTEEVKKYYVDSSKGRPGGPAPPWGLPFVW